MKQLFKETEKHVQQKKCAEEQILELQRKVKKLEFDLSESNQRQELSQTVWDNLKHQFQKERKKSLSSIRDYRKKQLELSKT